MKKTNLGTRILATLALTLIACEGSQAGWPENLPPEVPDYAGVTADNFWEKHYSGENPHGGYVMPEIKVEDAVVVDGKDGRDENPGTLVSPFRTIARGLEALKPGGMLVIREGEYILREPLQVTADHAGTPEEPTVITGHPEESVTITAAEPVAGWQKLDGHDEIWMLPLADEDSEENWAMLFVDGAILPTVGQAEYLATGNRPALRQGTAALEEAPFIPEPGAWGIRDGVVYLRPADGKTPADLKIEAARHGTFSLLEIAGADNIIINRLRFERGSTLIRNQINNRLVIRHCILRQARVGVSGSGRRVEPLHLDYNLMESNGYYRGRNIYNLTPMNIRYCLFRDMPPQGDAITVYTSTPDQFHNVHIDGCTFLHTGAGLYLVSGTSSVRNCVAFSSRFVSSSGSGNVIENNFVVFDPRDIDEADSPRRNIGIRMYANKSSVKGNVFIGFRRGMLVRQRSEETESHIHGNRFYGYNHYGLFLFPNNLDRLVFKNNLFAPIEDGVPVAHLRNVEDPHDLRAFEGRVGGEDNLYVPGAEAPPIPRVIREAMKGQ